MENQTIFKLWQDDDQLLTCGLARLIKNLPDYELFFALNCINSFEFRKKEDLIIQGKYFDYCHAVFAGYSYKNKSCFYFFSNQSSHYEKKNDIHELFAMENETNYLLPAKTDVDYIIKSSDASPDFSVISLPENIMFQIQNYDLTSEEKLYSLIQYYE